MSEQITTAAITTADDVRGFHCGAYFFSYQPVLFRSSYVVQPGDSLFAIAQRTYGDGRLWPALFAANADQIANPNLIYPGQVLRLV
jgi:nucleoid-associated protein YgaU